MTATVDNTPASVVAADPPAAPAPRPAATRRATSVVVGAFTLVWDRTAAQPAGTAPATGRRWRDLAVGTLFGAEAGDTAVERMTARLLGRRPVQAATPVAADPP